VDHPKDVGDRTTLAVMMALRELGFAVLVPFGENTRYDLAIDDGERPARVQCKTGRLRFGAVRWARVDPPRNGQRKQIREAEKYEIGLVPVRARAEPDATSGA
jgi:PD-(D/E)XK endonuclease